MSELTCKHSHIEIPEYYLGQTERLEHKLSIWDTVRFQYNQVAFFYDEENHCLRIPNIDLNYLKGCFKDRVVHTIYEPDPYDSIKIRLMEAPRSELQQQAIQFLIGEGDYHAYSKYSQLLLNLDTGEGKTYACIAAVAYKQLKTLVIVNSNRIKLQWIGAFSKFTNLYKEDILDIDSSAVCDRIIKAPSKFKKYKIFIVNHDTLHSFATREGNLALEKLIQSLKVGIKIIDEVHLCYENTFRIDCFSNVKYTYYLTATVGRSDSKENSLFTYCFENVPKYIQRQRGYTESKKHIVYCVYKYDSHPPTNYLYTMRNAYGFNRSAYAKYQLREDMKFLPNIYKMIDAISIKNNYKTLITISTIEGIEFLCKLLSEHYPDKKVLPYHSKMDKTVKEQNVLDGDILISTIKSLGVGADIPHLKVIINLETFKSAIITEQLSGRLRHIDEKFSYYIDIIDWGFPPLRRYQHNREKTLSKSVGKIVYIEDK